MNKKSICLLCESSKLNLITNKVRFGHKADVYKCQSCDLTFVDQNSFKFPKDFYEKQYHQTYITHVEPDALNPKAYYEKMRKSTKIWSDKFNAMLSGKEVVLDIGCSTGHFMDLVKNKTSKIYGSDLNQKEIEFCRKTLKFDVSDEPLEERFAQETFDYITMIYVLEHIAKPKEFLLSVKKLLKPEGRLIILVPNIQDALINFYDIPEFRSFYYCIEHLFYYNSPTIGRLLDSVGLKGTIEVIQEYPITNHLNWAYRRAPSETLASRRRVPDVCLNNEVSIEAWEGLWQEFNQTYQDFLKKNGFGDRLWCVVGASKQENQ